MKKTIIFICGVLAVFVMTGCATIFSGSNTDVTFSTNAPDATVVVRKIPSGVVVTSGKAPLTAKLKTSKDILVPATYQYEVIDQNKKKQSRVLETNFNPLFIGNFILGGIIGMGVDCISGACYKFDSEVYVHFSEYDNNITATTETAK